MITKQEMFTKAVKGLKGQSFRQASVSGNCQYETDSGDRCAWGHVDTDLTAADEGSVVTLWRNGQGVAAQLGQRNLDFASELQKAHDDAEDPKSMKKNLQALAKKYHLKGAPQ